MEDFGGREREREMGRFILDINKKGVRHLLARAPPHQAHHSRCAPFPRQETRALSEAEEGHPAIITHVVSDKSASHETFSGEEFSTRGIFP